MAQDLIEKIRAAAQAKGVDPEVALSIARAESELNPNAKAKSSSASGLFQILNETWAGNKGAPGKQFDPDENIRVGTDIISQNVKSLKKFLGRDPSPKEVYAAHYFGATGAQKFLSAAPDTPAKQLFSEEILAANSNLQGKTAAQILAQLEGKLKIPASNVPRETTVAKKEREPLPPSLPPMAEATPTKAPTATVMASALNAGGRNMPDIKSMPASYQAAFALSALADAQDDEDEKAYNENRETESEKLMREYKPVNHLASLDLSVKPITMKDGGEVDAEDRPDDIKYFSNVNKRKERGTTTESVMLGARTKAGEGSFVAGLNMANMSRDEKMQTARALMLAYTQQDPEGLGFSANVVKPQGAPAMANLMGSLPLGEGRVSAGVQGNQGYSLGYSQPLEGGQFNANLNVPRGTMGSPQLNLQYNKRFAGGGEAVKSAANDLLKFIDSQGLSVSDVVAAFGKRGVPWSTAFYSGDLNTDEDLELRARRMKNSTIDEPRSGDSGIVRRADGSPEEGERLTPQQMEQYVGQKTKAELLLEKFKEQAHPRNYTSIIGLGPNMVYEAYKYATGKDPLRDFQKELQKKIDYEVDTDLEPIGTSSGPISGSLPPIRRADGSPEEGERLTPQQIERIAAQGPTERRDEPFFDAASRTYVDVLTGRREPITEKDFTAKEQMAMMDAVRRSQARGGKGRVDYEDYPDSNTVGPGYVNIKNTLGGFQYKQGLDGSTIISDKYDFHGPRVAEYEKMGSGEKLVKSAKNALVEFVTSGGGVRDLAGELGRAYVGSKGPEVNIRIPVNRAEGSPPTGERKLDRETMDMLRKQGTSPASLQRVAPPADINSSAAGLPGLMLLADPRIDNTNAYGYMLDGGDDTKNRAMAQAMFLNKSRSEDYPDTIAHETEHLLARQNLGSAANINSKFDELIGNKGTSRLNFVRDAVKAAPYLKEKYDLQSSYLDPKMFEYQSKFGLGKNLLYEQLASLSALEQRHKIDLTKDEELRKTLFSRPDVRETYNAITGLRQTRLDPRDLSPYTRVAEPGMLDAIKGVFKRADGGPVYRADGSPEEGERLTPQQIERMAAQDIAEREAASNAAFIAQKSGIGRKAGPVSQALQSGQGYIEAAKGFTMLPQELVGGAFDLSNMVAGIYGGNVDKPIFGSENLKEQSRKAGIAFKPSDDPTLAGFFRAGELGSNLTNPAGVTRSGVKAAEKTGEAARMLAQDFQQYNQNLAVPGASYAVRNKGTPFTMTYGRSTETGRKQFPAMDQAEQYVKGEVAITKDKGLNDWLSNKVTAYLRRDFATPDDQFVKAAEANQLLHFVNKPIKRTDLDPYYSRAVDLDLENMNLPIVRKTEGFKPKGEARTEYGQRVEDLTDASAWPIEIGDISSTLPALVPPNMRAMAQTNPSERLTELGTNITKTLQFEDLASEMASMRSMPKTFSVYSQPAIKVPEEYMLTDEALVGLTLPQASNRVAKFRNWQEENRLKMASTALFKDPTINRTPAGNGSIWINPDDLQKNPNMLKLVQDVGCDGGWCTKGESLALNHGSGENRLSILMDSKGRPKAQMTITTSEPSADNFLMAMDDAEAAQFKAKYPDLPIYIESEVKSTPEYQKWESYNPPKTSITEIKGVYDKEDLWDEPYLKQIQDRIQSMEVEEVKDLDKIRMIQMPEYPNQLYNFFNPTFTQKMDLADNFGTVENGMRAVKDKAVELNKGSQFVIGDKDNLGTLFDQAISLLVPTKQPMTDAEMKAMLQKRINPSKATGGMIERQPTDNRRYL